MSGPLSHLKVLDLSRVLAGPWCGQLLADLGAEVIKVERPGTGDDTRGWGPPYLKDGEGRTTAEAAYYLSCNRGKQSVTIDMAHPDGQALIRDLAAKSDVVLENFKVGGLKKYGLDYESLKVVNPGLVYCSVTGFGQDGPYAHRAGYDFMIQGMAGIMSLTGEPDGMPTKTGVAFADIFTGMYATVGVLAALAERDRSGKGAYVDMALLDVQVAVLGNQALNYLTSGKPPSRMGNAHPNIVPYQAFATLDGHLILAVGNDGQFARFCSVAGRPDLAEDERFRTNAGRVENRVHLVPVVAGLVAGRTTDEWLVALEKVGVPCGPINTLDRVFSDPQIVHRAMKQTLPHTQAGQVDLVACPIRLDGKQAVAGTAPPTLGQNTDEVLARWLDLDERRRSTLRAAGVL